MTMLLLSLFGSLWCCCCWSDPTRGPRAVAAWLNRKWEDAKDSVRDRGRALPKQLSYRRHWRCWDRCVYVGALLFAALGAALIGYGVHNTTGNVAKMIGSRMPVYSMGIGAVMLALAALAADTARFFLPGWAAVSLALSTALFVVTALVVTFEYDHEEAMRLMRAGWTRLDFESRSELQVKYTCCGFDFYQDNAVLPCSSDPRRGCRVLVEPEVDARLTATEWLVWATMIVQGVAALAYVPYVFALRRHAEGRRDGRSERERAVRAAEVEALLADSLRLRSGASIAGTASGAAPRVAADANIEESSGSDEDHAAV
jgi:hypothetical protein